MIGFLSGILHDTDDRGLIISVAGVGYQVIPSASVTNNNTKIGLPIELFIHTHVREDQLALFGFSTKEELKLFELLLSVSGVGPKSALAVLSAGSPDEVRTAIAAADVEFFKSVSGIGKKTAQRIIVDLKSKVGSISELDLSDLGAQHQELFLALRSMGFKPQEFKDAVKLVDSSLPLDKQIKQALKHL